MSNLRFEPTYICFSYRRLAGEPGFMYQNLPLRKSDSAYAGNRITLKIPYRNVYNYEISICPLPLCLIEDGDEMEDCTKIEIKIPDWRGKGFRYVSPALPTLTLENNDNCQRSSLFRTFQLRTILLEPQNTIFTFKIYNSSYDLVFLARIDGSWFSTYLCPDAVYHKLEFLQRLNKKEGKVSMETCFIQNQKEETGDWVLWGVCAVIGVVAVTALGLIVREKIKMKTKRLPSDFEDEIYDDQEEIEGCKFPQSLLSVFNEKHNVAKLSENNITAS